MYIDIHIIIYTYMYTYTYISQGGQDESQPLSTCQMKQWVARLTCQVQRFRKELDRLESKEQQRCHLRIFVWFSLYEGDFYILHGLLHIFEFYLYANMCRGGSCLYIWSYVVS